MHARISLVLAFLAVPLFAQTVTLTATSVTPLVARASEGGPVVVVTQAPGAMATNGQVQTNPGSGAVHAAFHWQRMTDPYSASYLWQNIAIVNTGAPGAFAETDLADVLLTVSASSPVSVGFTIRRDVMASAGAPNPICRVDIDNDGTFEVTETMSTPWISPSLTLDAQPRQILIRTRVALIGSGSINVFGRFDLLPRNDLSISPLVAGCYTGTLQVAPTFVGNGFAMLADPITYPDLTVGVLGLGLQPLLLPSPFPACVLLPAPDLLVLLPIGLPVSLALPAAVRPVTVHVQGAVLTSIGLGTTNGFSVVAN